jgi:hypothetical protein
MHRAAATDEASPHQRGPPSPPYISARPRWHAPGPAAPVRKSADQSWWLFFQAVRGPRAPSPSCTRRGLRDEEKHSHSPQAHPPRLRGGRNHGPMHPHDGRHERRAGRTDGRRVGVRRARVLCLRRSTEARAHASNEPHAWRWRHRTSPAVTPPIFVCVRPSVPSVHSSPFSVEDDGATHHRSCPARPLPPSRSRYRAPNVSFCCRDGTAFVHGALPDRSVGRHLLSS